MIDLMKTIEKRYFNMPNPILDYIWINKNIYIKRIFVSMVEKVYRDKTVLNREFNINPFYIIGAKSNQRKLSVKDYKKLKTACKGLMGIVIDHANVKGHRFRYTQLVTLADYKNGNLVVKFSEFVVYLIKNIVEVTYTKQHFQSIISLKSPYALCIYDLFIKKIQANKSKTTSINLTIIELRKKLDVPDGKHKKWLYLKQGVIERVQIYLRKFTNINFSYKPIKVGVRVTGIEFIVYYNKEFIPMYPKKTKKELPKETHLLLLKKYLPIEDLYNKAVKFQGNNPRYIRYIVNQFNDDKANGRIKSNLVGYFFKIFMNNHEKYLAEHEIEKRRKENQRLRLKRCE